MTTGTPEGGVLDGPCAQCIRKEHRRHVMLGMGVEGIKPSGTRDLSKIKKNVISWRDVSISPKRQGRFEWGLNQ